MTYHINDRNPVQAPPKRHVTEVKTENRQTTQAWPHWLDCTTEKSNIGCNSLIHVCKDEIAEDNFYEIHFALAVVLKLNILNLIS